VDVALHRGARVLALARSFEESVSAGDQVVRRPTDLARLDDIPGAAELAAFLTGAREVLLINNAATIEPIGAVGRLHRTAIAAAVATNLTATMVLTDALLSALTPGRGPTVQLGPDVTSVRLLYVSTSSAHRPKPATAAYCATKAGGEMFFAVLRAELEHDPRFVVEVVDPGGMDTDMHRGLRGRTGVYFPDQERLRQMAAEGRLAAPDVVARRIMDAHLP
jgi:NAD(P)-dependent dehydrogenase (short-subunit alcohol dehydrogenase family)